MTAVTSDHAATGSDHGADATVATAPVTVEQAAAILGVSVSTVRRRIRDGSIRAEEARRPQGPVWLVYLPADATSATTSDRPAATATATAPTNAENMVAYTRSLLEPLVAALERSQARVAELEREAGTYAERMAGLECVRDAAMVYAAELEARLEAAADPQPAPAPDPFPAPIPPTPNVSPARHVGRRARPWHWWLRHMLSA